MLLATCLQNTHTFTYTTNYFIIIIMGEATVPRDVLHIPLLPGGQSRPRPGKGGMVAAAVLGSIILVTCLVVAMVVTPWKMKNINSGLMPSSESRTTSFECYPRGVGEGVSSKSNEVINSNSCLSISSHKVSYNWTNAMFSWQRTSYHFQPQKNWMNGNIIISHFISSFLFFLLITSTNI